MTDILEKLYAVPETGADPELIDEAAAEIERLKAELDATNAALKQAYQKGYDTGREEVQGELDAVKSKSILVQLVEEKISSMTTAEFAQFMEAKAALATPVPSVPEGYQLVPVEPTQAMLRAWDSAASYEDNDADIRSAYRAMLTAAKEES